MYKIDSDGATSNSEFTNGNANTGTPATALDAAWLNALQREQIAILTAAGIAPDKEDDGQIVKALMKGAGTGFNADKIHGFLPSTNADPSTVVVRNNIGNLPGSAENALKLGGLTPSEFLMQYMYPVGVFYTQYPNASSNDDSTEFPLSQRPATLFGGTWVEQWSTESVFFRTRGTLSDTGRSSGLQDDQFQGHWHGLTVQSSNTGPSVNNISFMLGTATATPQAMLTTGNVNIATSPITDSVNGTPKTGTETRSRNRRIKVWKRTA